MNKKQDLLVGIIQEYIKCKEPIGSVFLKEKRSICLSSATIRNYFKVLESEGALFQPHASSGRIPTTSALSTYWRGVLNYLLDSILCVNSTKLDSICRDYRIFCVIAPKESNELQEIIATKENFLILKFSRGEVVIKKSEAILRFLQPFINMDIADITRVSVEVGASDLALKLIALEQVDMAKNTAKYGVSNLKEILESSYFEQIFSGKIMLKKANGIYTSEFVPSGFVCVIHDVVNVDSKEKNKCARMLVFGSLLCDFEGFYTDLVA
ncbi:heat-inducible transcription repressor [Helicobacter saguini]|uniref:Heat-inducible transcription repressor n=1 Tax=Helicobacter saguini TaxID=1548018 RepID=A0A099B6H7_9HELI|nr:hypothetical protein [Helicobacter saguini]MWV60974.1 heat-inducible transcription repressor [Helicobacter saguini]MWV68357.1 heat-inducible transcription repressor [Helicobacter saguini]MWV70178.1 heat-inducible transcription repressor [Helicobacter saguini]MWV72081.1 heat-inducible transcription repressor [Helicobacter saguini]TLD93699.1 heat-inducible transcription repressor [Helicobacter saguini]